MYRIQVKSYPNNEIRATVQYKSNSGNWGGPAGAACCDADDGTDDTAPDPAPLDITLKLSDPLRPGFGGVPRATSFGNNARRTLSRASGVFDRLNLDPQEFVLLTGTIPGSTRESFDGMAKWSSWAVKSIKTWISDRGIKSAYSLYVWEFQKRGALHIHYCVHTKDHKERVWLLIQWKKKWSEIIDAISQREGVDMWRVNEKKTWATNKAVIQADAQMCERSVGAYLSKYLSKNAPANNGKGEKEGGFLCPVRWWGCSRPLLAKMRELTESFEVDVFSVREMHQIEEVITEEMKWSEGRTYSYWDKAGSTHVMLTYSPESWQHIYMIIWRDVYGVRIRRYGGTGGVPAVGG